MRTTLPVVLAVLIALSGILAVGGASILKTYTSVTSTQTSHQMNTPTPLAPNNNAVGQQPQGTVKLTQQPQNNQTCTGDNCSPEQGDK